MNRSVFKLTKLMFWVICIIFTGASEINATHIMGMDLTYKCRGNNQYEIYLTFYRDCNGIPVDSLPIVNWSAVCGSGSIPLQLTNMTEITPTCPGVTGSACNNGNGQYGIEEYSFQGIVTLPNGCTNIELNYFKCCRNGAITTLQNPLTYGTYVETLISDVTDCNHSPEFTNKPVPFICVGQPVLYNHGAIDIDGDQLSYSLVDCLTDNALPVPYNAGFSTSNPLSTTNGFTLDPVTGAISFTASTTQVGVICVLVEEFRNGVKVGEVVRDIQFTAVNCTNNVPLLSGIDNTNNYSTTASIGTQLCFDVFSNDIDSGQTTVLNWNSGITGATFTTNPNTSQNTNGTFCWTPTPNDVGINTFTITVSDDYCPIVGQNTYTYTIDILSEDPCDSLDLIVTSTGDINCTNNDGSAVLVASNGTPPYNYQIVNWSTGAFFNNSTGIFNNLTTGTYSIWVEDSNGCTPACSGESFNIGGIATPINASATTTDVSCSSNSWNSSSNADGSISVTASGGDPPYLFSIDGINFQPSGIFNNLPSGSYSIAVLDTNGCSININANISEPPAMQITVTNLTPSTCGQTNGSITLSASGGNGQYTYYIDSVSQGNNPIFTGLSPNTYVFSVYDGNNCTVDTSIVIPVGTAGFTVNATGVAPICNADCNGSALATVTPAINGASFLWDNGANSPSISALCAGTYTTTVTDNNGCTATASVTLVDPAPIAVTIVSSSDETCAFNDGTATLNVTGGTSPYVIELANFSNSNIYTSTSSTFNNLNEGKHIVKVTDANGCMEDCYTYFDLGGCDTSTTQTITPFLTSPNFVPVLTINPNPANSMIQVSYSTIETHAAITIMDINGQIIYSKPNLNPEGSLEVFITDWSNTTYFVVLRSPDNKVLKTAKLVITN